MTNLRQLILKLKRSGKTYNEIGKIVGFSRQYAHAIASNYAFIKRKSTKRIKNSDIKFTRNVDSSSYIPSSKFQGRDRLKEKVRMRDNWTCQICGIQWRKGERRLDVHHINELQEGRPGYKYKNCKDMNLQVTLCHKCHINLDVVVKKMQKSRKSYTQVRR